jgi:branched-chain amino acid transport system ATP-binding protein
MSLLEVRGLSAFYGAAQVVFDANLRLEAGEVVALVGRNGAGKTSLLRAIMGLMDGTRGSVVLAGNDLSRLPSFERARLGLGYVPEDRRIFSDLSVAENLRIAARPQAGGFNEAELLAIFPNLAQMLERRADQMSGGEQQMLAVARTLATNASIVLLDEPSEGIAPLVVEKMRETVVAMKARGVATLLAEQNLRFAASVSDRALLIEHGQLIGEVERDALLEPSIAVRKVLGL